MSKHLKRALIYLLGAAVVLAGCQSRPSSTATPTATSTRVVAPTPTLVATPTSAPSATPEPTAVHTLTPAPAPTATQAAASSPALAGSGYEEGFTDQGQPFRGDLAAPVVMEEFSSYQCGFCARYFRETFGQVIAEYVKTGQVLYVYRDFPLSSQPQSALAAEAANCAGKTGDGSTYWAMHDVLFARQSEWSGRGDAGAIFKEYARELELDGTAFGQCLDSGVTRALIESDVGEALARGVRGTPTFFIDGELLVGAQPYTAIATSIDAALAGQDTTETALELAPASALAPDLQQLPQHVQEAYRFALANPDALEVIPCYCGCNGVGHENNRMCYVQSETADGQVIFDRHAVT